MPPIYIWLHGQKMGDMLIYYSKAAHSVTAYRQLIPISQNCLRSLIVRDYRYLRTEILSFQEIYRYYGT